MLWEYSERYYVPAARCYEGMSRDGLAKAREIAAWKSLVERGWAGVRVESVEQARAGAHHVGEGFGLAATVRLGEISPADVAVEAYHGPLDATREVRRGQAVPLALERSLGGGVHRYAGTISCDRSGMQGYSVRVRPSHPEACDLLGTGLMTWWQGESSCHSSQ